MSLLILKIRIQEIDNQFGLALTYEEDQLCVCGGGGGGGG